MEAWYHDPGTIPQVGIPPTYYLDMLRIPKRAPLFQREEKRCEASECPGPGVEEETEHQAFLCNCGHIS